MSTQKLQDLLSTATHVVGQAEAEAYKGIGFNRGGDFPALRDEIKRLTAERDSLQRCYTPGKVQELEQERDDLYTICGKQRDEIKQATTIRNRLLDGVRYERNELQREVNDLRGRPPQAAVVAQRDELQRERDDLRHRLAATKRLVDTEQVRLHTHLQGALEERDELQREVDMLKVRLNGMLSYNERDDLRRDRDEFHRQLDTARMELRDERKGKRVAFRRVVKERDELQRELDAPQNPRGIRRLTEDVERVSAQREAAYTQLALCKQHRNALQEQVGLAMGRSDALQFDVDMLEAQVRSRDNAIVELMAVDAEFASALREAARNLTTLADTVEE